MSDPTNIFPNILWQRIRESECNAPEDRPVVLVVEDDPGARILMRYALREVVRTDAASTVADALRMAETVPYDGLLIDIDLPDGIGTQIVAELRGQMPYWGVPMVAVAAQALPGDQDFLEAGFDAFVAKPFKQDEIRTLVRHLLMEDDLRSGVQDRGLFGEKPSREQKQQTTPRREAPTTKKIRVPPEN